MGVFATVVTFVCPYSEVSNLSPRPNSITTKLCYLLWNLYILSSVKVRSRVIDCMRGVWRYISPRFVGRGCSNRLSQQYQQYNLVDRKSQPDIVIVEILRGAMTKKRSSTNPKENQPRCYTACMRKLCSV